MPAIAAVFNFTVTQQIAAAPESFSGGPRRREATAIRQVIPVTPAARWSFYVRPPYLIKRLDCSKGADGIERPPARDRVGLIPAPAAEPTRSGVSTELSGLKPEWLAESIPAFHRGSECNDFKNGEYRIRG